MKKQKTTKIIIFDKLPRKNYDPIAEYSNPVIVYNTDTMLYFKLSADRYLMIKDCYLECMRIFVTLVDC